jgi:hypothetical protein
MKKALKESRLRPTETDTKDGVSVFIWEGAE